LGVCAIFIVNNQKLIENQLDIQIIDSGIGDPSRVRIDSYFFVHCSSMKDMRCRKLNTILLITLLFLSDTFILNNFYANKD